MYRCRYFRTNVYRGVSFGDAFERVKKEYDKPVLFTEFGADAFNAVNNRRSKISSLLLKETGKKFMKMQQVLVKAEIL